MTENKRNAVMMRKTVGICIVSALCCLLPMFFTACKDDIEVQNPRLVEVEPFSATLSFTTERRTALVVYYGEGYLFDRQAFVRPPDTQHSVRLQGLKPATRYRYRFSPKGEIYTFRSAPQADGVFDLVLLDEASAGASAESVGAASMPDVVFTSGHISSGFAAHPAEVLTRQIPETGVLKMNYGSVTILAARDLEAALEAVNKENEKEEESKGRLLLLLPELPETPPPPLENAVLLSPRKAVFKDRTVVWENKQPAWLEIDAFEMAWVFGAAEGRERKLIVEAPPDARRSCLFCDRLMESGRYEESIRWYENFIEENSESQESVADARFSIAGIYDGKLFRFAEAIKMYKDFLSNHPASRRAALARFRIEQLEKYSDNDFAPLAAFERARAQLDPKRPEEAARSVEEVLKNYPEAAVAEEALFWLAHLLEKIRPESAAAYYEELMRRYPKSENAAMAAVSLGDMDYMSNSYSSAIARYEAALSLTPASYHIPIKEKLSKSKRNIWRERARWTSWGVLAFWLLLSLLYRARPRLHDVFGGSLFLSVYALIFGAYFIINYDKAQDILQALVASALAATLVTIWSRAFMRSGRRPCAVVLHALTATSAALYLVMYHLHMLYVFGI